MFNIYSYFKLKNFGDIISPFILNNYEIPCQFSNINNSNFIGIGSILQLVPESYTGAVWTSGFISSQYKKNLNHAKIFTVRGKYTWNNLSCNNKSEITLGDGGLLIGCNDYTPNFFKYKLGIFPHYVDIEECKKNLPFLNRPDVILINPSSKIETVIEQVKSCQSILSSSLHGLIVADSYKIPNRQFKISTSNKILGGMFKYNDYYSVFGIDAVTPLNLNNKTSFEQAYSSAQSFINRPNFDSVIYNLEKSTRYLHDWLYKI